MSLEREKKNGRNKKKHEMLNVIQYFNDHLMKK